MTRSWAHEININTRKTNANVKQLEVLEMTLNVEIVDAQQWRWRVCERFVVWLAGRGITSKVATRPTFSMHRNLLGYAQRWWSLSLVYCRGQENDIHHTSHITHTHTVWQRQSRISCKCSLSTESREPINHWIFHFMYLRSLALVQVRNITRFDLSQTWTNNILTRTIDLGSLVVLCVYFMYGLNPFDAIARVWRWNNCIGIWEHSFWPMQTSFRLRAFDIGEY